ncbi:kallistatin isoform X2 [Mastomys coucha]|nr:kallistatin isoform X2 [Mastomys coucha]
MYHTHCLLLLLSGFLVLSHSQPGQEPDNTSNQTYKEVSQQNISSYQIASDNADFAFRLYHLIASKNSEENIFFSPISISISLAMLSTGAVGDTQTQILKGLGFNLTKVSEPEIHEGFRSIQHKIARPFTELQTSIGNILVLSQALRVLPDFDSAIESSYISTVLYANFGDKKAVIQLINDYVKEKTQGKIKEVISDLDSDVRMVLVNYIFFRGLWEKPFPSGLVSTGDFYVDENMVVKVPMMLQYNQKHWYLEDRHVPCKVLQMDYRGDAVAFFILPNLGKMNEVEKALSPGMLTRWHHLLQNRSLYKSVGVKFPKFSISTSYPLEGILPDLGFQNLFSPHANFSNMVRKVKLRLSKVVHKATLDVNEAGTEAAAVTVSSIAIKSAGHEIPYIEFNRPFFVVIYSPSSKSILFMGKVVKPKAPQSLD